MTGKGKFKFTLCLGSATWALLAWSLPVAAQCAMCKNAVTGSPEAARLSQSLNFAILVLLIPPVLIFCGIFFLAFRYRKSLGTNTPSQADGLNLSDTGSTKTGARLRRKERRGPGDALA